MAVAQRHGRQATATGAYGLRQILSMAETVRALYACLRAFRSPTQKLALIFSQNQRRERQERLPKVTWLYPASVQVLK